MVLEAWTFRVNISVTVPTVTAELFHSSERIGAVEGGAREWAALM